MLAVRNDVAVTTFPEPQTPITRRRLLALGGGGLVAAGLAACSSDDGGTPGAGSSASTTPPSASEVTEATSPATAAPTTPGTAGSINSAATVDSSAATAEVASVAPSPGTAFSAADFDGLATCTLVPEQTEGPFYLVADLLRRDVTEGVAGAPLRLGLRVVDAACVPVPGAIVDIWHADPSGDYSGFVDGGSTDDAGPGTTFLRGTQQAGDDGIVEFATLYPGWYPGRAIHIHVKVWIASGSSPRTVLTTQVYFDEAVTERVLATSPYDAREPAQRTRNEDDAIAGDVAATGLLVAVTGDVGAQVGLVNLGIGA